MGKIEPDIVKGFEFEPNVFKYTSSITAQG